MRYPLLLFILFSGYPVIKAQYVTLKSHTDSLSFSVVNQDGHIALRWESNPALPLNRDYISFETVQLDGTDLVIYYQTKTSTTESMVDFTIALQPENGFRFAPPQDRWIDLPDKIEGKSTRKGKAFLDITEGGLVLGKRYDLFIFSQLQVQFKCDESKLYIPQSRTWAMAGTGVVGAGLVTLGGIYYHQSGLAYQDYLDYWKAGKTLSEAESSRTQAWQKNKNSRLLLAGGGILLSANFAWWLSEKAKVKRYSRSYHKYCRPDKEKVSFHPIFGDHGTVGICLQF